MNTIEFDNKTFYPLNGLAGYYATLDGEVLSTKFSPKILRHGENTARQSYHLSVNGKIKNITKARIIYMVQTGCKLDEMAGAYCGVKAGKAIISEKKSDVESKKACDPLKAIDALRCELSLLSDFYTTKNIKPLKQYIDRKREELEKYGIVCLNQGREKVIRLVDEVLSDFYTALYEFRITRGIIAYIKGIMRKVVAVQRKERAMLVHEDFILDTRSLEEWRMQMA